jgi:hypothetical protein
MGHSRRPKRKPEASSAVILPILQARAEERGTMLGHTFGVWGPAKKRFGKSSIKTLCETCGMQAVAMPHGEAHSTLKLTRDNPGLLGEALVETCVRLRIVEPPAGTLGLRS